MTKEALTLALEALKLHEKIMHPYCDQQTERALKAIEEALQSNEQELDYKAIGQQAYESGYSTGYMDCAVKMKAQPEQEPESNAYDDQRNSMEQAFRKPEQEPVARIVKQGATVKLEWVNADSAHNAKVGNLYTTPPQRTWVEVEQVKWEGDKLIAKLKEKNSL